MALLLIVLIVTAGLLIVWGTGVLLRKLRGVDIRLRRRGGRSS